MNVVALYTNVHQYTCSHIMHLYAYHKLRFSVSKSGHLFLYRTCGHKTNMIEPIINPTTQFLKHRLESVANSVGGVLQEHSSISACKSLVYKNIKTFQDGRTLLH